MHNGDYVDLGSSEETSTFNLDVALASPPPPSPTPLHVMLDLETWGTGNKALPVSIGACRFDKDTILDKFHVAIDPVSAQAHGLEIDAETMLWWLDPERDEARAQWLKQQRVDIGSALGGFAE